jgi:hypothetical protein
MPEQLKGANPRPVRLVMATTIAVCVLLYALVGALLARLFLWSVFVRTWSPYGMLGIVLIPFAVFGVWGGIYFGTRIIMAALKVDGPRL